MSLKHIFSMENAKCMYLPLSNLILILISRRVMYCLLNLPNRNYFIEVMVPRLKRSALNKMLENAHLTDCPPSYKNKVRTTWITLPAAFRDQNGTATEPAKKPLDQLVLIESSDEQVFTMRWSEAMFSVTLRNILLDD